MGILLRMPQVASEDARAEAPRGALDAPPATGSKLVWWLRGTTLLERLRELALVPLRTAFSFTRRAPLIIREELPFMLNRRGLVGCGVEVGVKAGEFSELLLDRWEGRHLISVDPWLESPLDDYPDVANVEQETHDDFHRQTVERLRRFGDRSSVWRMTGTEAAGRIPHHSLDFVYLDARHDYESVNSDLHEWFDRIRPGGIFAGHDYVDGVFADGRFGVRSAVDEFFGARGLRVRSTLVDPPWISWWVELPRR